MKKETLERAIVLKKQIEELQKHLQDVEAMQKVGFSDIVIQSKECLNALTLRKEFIPISPVRVVSQYAVSVHKEMSLLQYELDNL